MPDDYTENPDEPIDNPGSSSNLDVFPYEKATPEQLYNGAHSIRINPIGTETYYNSWETWRLIPTGKLVVAPPEVKTEYVDLPGENGSLDFTGLLSGLKYKDRSGSWDFYFVKDLYEQLSNGDGNAVYSTLLNAIHGKECRVWLLDDPDWGFLGRLAVSSWKEEEHRVTVTINYLFRPYKTKQGGQKSL